MTDQEKAEGLAMALLSSVIAENRPGVERIIQKHGLRPEPKDDDLYAQIVMLSNERGAFFDVDLNSAIEEANYFDPVSLAMMATKMGKSGTIVEQLKKFNDRHNITTEEANTPAEGGKSGKGGKIRELLGSIFNRKNAGKKAEDLVKDPATDKLLSGRKSDTPAKTILGMSVTTFWIVVAIVAVLFIVAVVLLTRRRKLPPTAPALPAQ